MAAKKFQTHHGMHDLLPEDTINWQKLESIIHKVAARYHFQEIRTPILEPTELIARGVGQLTDIVSKEMFTFERGEDHYCLRPEGTAPVARAYVQHNLHQRGGSQKLFYIGPFFRAERPQKGRQRQFHQFGAELIGTPDPMADIEIISMMMEIYNEIGLTDTSLLLNSVGDPETRKNYKSALQEHFKPNLEKMSEVSQNRFQTNPMRILDSKEKEDQPFIENAPVIGDYLSEQSRNHFDKVCHYLKQLEIPYQIEPRLVRGLDYYTETAFELISDHIGSQDALGGGGRYDLLIEDVGGPPTPAVGFACGIERLFLAAQSTGVDLNVEESLDVYIVTRGEQAREWALNNLEAIRKLGISATMNFDGKSIKAQMKDANRKLARFSVIVGDEELESDQFTLRNMHESEEYQLSKAELLEKLSGI